MNKNSFDAIIFDLGGVVLNLDYDATINAFKAMGKENFEQIYTQAHQDQIFDLFETGEISSDEFRDYFRKLLGREISNQQIDDAWNALLLDLPPERIELLRRLRNDYKIFLFSNTNAIHIDAFRKIIRDAFGDPDLLEKVFHKTYYSHLVGRRKPNAEAFELVLKKQNLIPERTLFIDDSKQHIEGAEKLGIQTVHLVDKAITDLF